MKVFIGSATTDIAYAEIIAKILTDLYHEPILWTDQNVFIPSKTIYDNLFSICKTVNAAIFIFGNSEELKKSDVNSENIYLPRDNVLIEYGMFSTFLHYTRTHIIRFDGSKIASDLSGIIITNYDNEHNLRKKIKVWVEDISKYPSSTPYTEYLNALNEIQFLVNKLKILDDDLVKIANKHDINYKQTNDDPEKELWKILFAPELRSELIDKIIKFHPNEVDLNDFLTYLNMKEYTWHLKLKYLPYPKKIGTILKNITIDIMEKKISPNTFHSLFDCMDKDIYDFLYTNVHQIAVYWENEKDKINLVYKNVAG